MAVVMERVGNKIYINVDKPEELEAVKNFFRTFLMTDRIRFRRDDGYYFDLHTTNRENICKLLKVLENSNSTEIVVEVDE